MNAVESLYATLDAFSPHVERRGVNWQTGPVTLLAPGYEVVARGDHDLALTFPYGIAVVTMSEHRDALSGFNLFDLRVNYLNGWSADARYLSARERDGLALVLRAMVEAQAVAP